tara:strand:- start:61 stop:744 length:684 start_codon:yes stop_codon:yes gene_type:complete
MSRAREIADRDLAATELILDADNDTSITADTDDRIDFKTGGTDRLQVQSTSGNNVVIADGLTLTDGNLIVASGHGIDFSATANASNGSMDNELFDDYEEGTFTPTLDYQNTSGLTLSYDSQVGHYTKIGRMVHLYISLQADISGSLVNDNLSFSSLPYSIATSQGSTGAVVNIVNASGGGADKNFTLQPQGTRIYFSNSQGNGNMADDIGTGTNVLFQVGVWYFVAT